MILLYPVDDKSSSTRIAEIRETYRKTFDQESVLRVDDESCVVLSGRRNGVAFPRFKHVIRKPVFSTSLLDLEANY